MNNIITNFSIELGAVLAEQFYDHLKRTIHDFRQLNDNTRVDKLVSRHHEIFTPYPPGSYPEVEIRIEKVAKKGFYAWLWRLWQATLPDAPDHGFDVERRFHPAPIFTRSIRVGTYGTYFNDLDGMIAVSLRGGYDPVDDVLYVQELDIKKYP